MEKEIPFTASFSLYWGWNKYFTIPAKPSCRCEILYILYRFLTAMLSICILPSTVFCSVALSLVTVYTIESYILSVHVRCINLYVYNIIFTAKKLPGKQLFTYFREANIFFYLRKTGAKSLPELFTPVHFFKYSDDRFYFCSGVTSLPDTIFT